MDDVDDDRWLVVDGRRWRRSDPLLPHDVIDALKSHLGRGRAAVRVAKKREDPDAVAHARHRVNLAKHGLGERGEPWWDMTAHARLHRAQRALQQLDELDALH
ncbi:biopolymer transporter Tol [Microbacterium sp. M3]|uniref:Biopolymer transporter Tol n=1 Tax=Microbacterium arthrosphaerae TaxID=792652 RepID=A0ABU4H0W0_9MICO|nr:MULTISPECIES: biopolymer transporter Tol [Microbacterium]MDW4572963.1 biopolymer transporter Tol [Microbacterium arthrosphaerae]MDW7606818.1 biopolymer transporter Tol [Microbacterium sp. M3]